VRSVSLLAFVAEALAQHIETYPPIDATVRVEGQDEPATVTGFIFSNRDSGPVTYHAWRRRPFASAAKRAGLDGLNPHALRHTATSLMARAGRSEVEVQRELGHSNTTMTKRYHDLFEEDREAQTKAYDATIRAAAESPDAFLMPEEASNVVWMPAR